MDEAKSCKTAGAFRTALETRMQSRAREEGTDLQRLRRQVAFDRFLAPPTFPVISAEQQFAEKLHAYTLPRGERVNTRTKDLIDIVLLIRGEKLDKGKTAAAVRTTFAKRATHDVPKELDRPPAEWGPVFDDLAKECDLAMKLRQGFEVVREFTRTLET